MKLSAATLIVLTALFGLGLCCAGLLSAPDSLVILLAGAMCASMTGAWGLVAVCYLKLHLKVRAYLDRQPLTDEEFVAALPSQVEIDPDVVRQVRSIAVESFGPFWGDRFCPGDRLDEDLHLGDVAPWASEVFWRNLEEQFGEDAADATPTKIVTFGDVVAEANRRRRVMKGLE